MRTRISTIIRRANARNKIECAGAQCQYCKKQATCAALRQLALPIAPTYEGLSIPEEIHASAITDPRTMAHCLDCVRVLEEWCKSVKFHAVEMSLNGAEIPRYRLATRSGKRSVSDALAAFGVVQDKMSLEAFLACCGSVSIDELAKAYSKDAPRGQKTKTRDKLHANLRPEPPKTPLWGKRRDSSNNSRSMASSHRVRPLNTWRVPQNKERNNIMTKKVQPYQVGATNAAEAPVETTALATQNQAPLGSISGEIEQ